MDRSAIYREIYGYLARLGATDRKEDILEPFGKSRLRDLTDAQLLRVRNDLWLEADRVIKASRSEVLCLLRDLGLYQKPYSETSREFFARVDAFVSQPRIAGKPFRFLTIAELRELYVKLRALQRKGVKVAERSRILSNLKPS